MKTPLHYQMTEYDCGPITVMNAIIYLFEREQIPPDLIRNIMLYCLDGYGAEGAPGCSGDLRQPDQRLRHSERKEGRRCQSCSCKD